MLLYDAISHCNDNVLRYAVNKLHAMLVHQRVSHEAHYRRRIVDIRRFFFTGDPTNELGVSHECRCIKVRVATVGERSGGTPKVISLSICCRIGRRANGVGSSGDPDVGRFLLPLFSAEDSVVRSYKWIGVLGESGGSVTESSSARVVSTLTCACTPISSIISTQLET